MPFDPPRAPPHRALPRLLSQVAGSPLVTVFYTPGGAAGWALDLVLRTYFSFTRPPRGATATEGQRLGG
jgi:hypothetical protein